MITLAVLLAGLALGFGPAFAAMDSSRVSPKGFKGSDVRAKVEPKGMEGPDVR